MNELLAEGDLGRTFLGCRGIAGGMLRDESPVVVDRLATLIHNGEARCPECAGYGRVLDGDRCDHCEGCGVDGDVVFDLIGADLPGGERQLLEEWGF